MDPPSSGGCSSTGTSHPAGFPICIELLLHPWRGSQQVVLPRLVRNCVANPAHQPVPPALRHVLFLGPEEIQAWPHRQRRHQDEWIHPALVAEAVQARAIRQASAAFHGYSEQRSNDQRRQCPSKPVPNGPPQGMHRRGPPLPPTNPGVEGPPP